MKLTLQRPGSFDRFIKFNISKLEILIFWFNHSKTKSITQYEFQNQGLSDVVTVTEHHRSIFISFFSFCKILVSKRQNFA